MLFDAYVYVGVIIIAQSILAWELGTKGWAIALPKNCLRPRVTAAVLVFVVQVVWQRLAGLQFPIQSLNQAWPVLLPIGVFVYAITQQRLLTTLSPEIPRLSYFVRAKQLYYAYNNRLGVALEKMTANHFAAASGDASLQEAEELFKRAIDLSRREGQNRDAAIAAYQLGMLYHVQGRSADATRSFEEALKTLNEYQSAVRQ